MALFLSTFANKVDRKGRVSVPATFRAALSAQPFAGIICFPSFTSSCLEGMDMDRLEAIANGLDSQADAFSPEQSDMAHLVFSESRQLTWDSEGRVVLPEDFLAHARIDGLAAFVGKGKTFQIWEPETLKATMADLRAKAQAAPPTIRLNPLPAKGGTS